jgi:hypothetical protein
MIIAILSTLLIGIQAQSTMAITGQSTGYVQYTVNISGLDEISIPSFETPNFAFPDLSMPNFSIPDNFLISQTSTPTEQSGFVSVTLEVSSDASNFKFSKNLNSTSLPMIFPYLSGLTNQSLTYTFEGISLSANLMNTGQIPVHFNENTYQATKYLISLSATNSSSMKSISVDGNIISMPSGLIYSIQLSLDEKIDIDITLKSTDLELNEQTNNVDPLGASMLGIGALAAVAIAIPTIFKKILHNKSHNQVQSDSKHSEGKNNENDKNKPNYWVD